MIQIFVISIPLKVLSMTFAARSIILAFFFTCFVTQPLKAQDDSQELLDRIEERLHEAHVEWVYWPKGFHQEWLPDGSGYVLPRDES